MMEILKANDDTMRNVPLAVFHPSWDEVFSSQVKTFRGVSSDGGEEAEDLRFSWL